MRRRRSLVLAPLPKPASPRQTRDAKRASLALTKFRREQEPDSVSVAARSRSHEAVISVYEAGNVIRARRYRLTSACLFHAGRSQSNGTHR